MITFKIKKTEVPTPTPWIVYEHMGDDIVSGSEAVCCCFTQENAQHIAVALAVLADLDRDNMRLAVTVDGTWRALNHVGTLAATAEIADNAGLLGADQPAWEVRHNGRVIFSE